MDAYVEDFAAYSDEICRASSELTVIFGNVAVDPGHKGQDGRRRKYQCRPMCVSNGEYVIREDRTRRTALRRPTPKTLHPN